MSPIAAYLEELAGLLRPRARRRILAEVRAHLLDAAVAQPGEAAESAQNRAVARFGSPAEVARAFNSVRRPRRPRAIASRAAAVVLASAATASVGTATVWALEPGTARHAHAAAHPRHGDRRHPATARRSTP